MSATHEPTPEDTVPSNAGTVNPKQGWHRHRGRLLWFAIPFALILGWCLLMRPEPATLLAPAFGPWAGILFGHHECTLANVSPGLGVGLAVFGVASLLGASRLRSRGLRRAAWGLATVWAVGWELSAALSVANTCA